MSCSVVSFMSWHSMLFIMLMSAMHLLKDPYILVRSYVRSSTFSIATEGCQSEVDEEWQLSWPFTLVGSVAIQKCGGADSIG